MSGNEAKTRKDIIDKRLQVAGWNVSDHTQVVEEFDISVPLPDGVSPASRIPGVLGNVNQNTLKKLIWNLVNYLKK